MTLMEVSAPQLDIVEGHRHQWRCRDARLLGRSARNQGIGAEA
jgi:hypothetical protein